MDNIVAKIICGPDADDMYNFYKGEKDPGLCEKCKTRLEMMRACQKSARLLFLSQRGCVIINFLDADDADDADFS